MKLADLKSVYPETALSYFPSNNELRFKAFSPALLDLFENKVVYFERFICIVSLSDVRIAPDGFGATATPLLPIKRKGPFHSKPPGEPWSFGADWRSICFTHNHLAVPYVGWSIWPEADTVRAVERLARNGDFEAALGLMFHHSGQTWANS